MTPRMVTVSVVSHAQNGLVNALVDDLWRHCSDAIELLLTENALDATRLARSASMVNETPKGFGANHNAAFERCGTPYFCVCNPDVRLRSDPFPPLLQALQQDRAGVVGPLVRRPAGQVEDSARRFPTAGSLVRKLFRGSSGPDYPADRGRLEVDWVAGMFMLFPSDAFRAVGGFDERYFLYYEDVDLCRRLHAAGRRVLYEPRSEVIHDARRASRRSPALAMHHAKSGLRYLLTK